jgi:glycosyltransferase involved in cell wall biosynthesis
MISILTPTKNTRPEMLAKLIASVERNTYTDWELIIQNCGEELHHKNPKIKIYNEKDTGISNALNKAIAKSYGDLFVWLNDDDEIYSNMFEYITSHIGAAQWCYAKINIIGENRTWGFPWSFNIMKYWNVVAQPTTFWTRHAGQEIGAFDESCNLSTCMDYDFWFRLGQHFYPRFFDVILANYYFHPDAISIKQKDLQEEQAQKCREKYKHIYVA